MEVCGDDASQLDGDDDVLLDEGEVEATVVEGNSEQLGESFLLVFTMSSGICGVETKGDINS